MAINATFQADFSGFLSAIDKAELALVDFSKGASKVESSLNKMTDSFSGRKIIQEASLLTIAVEKAGGTATLTARELEQVGAKANEAADKMKRLGYEVPAGLQKLADETKKLSDTQDKAAVSFGTLVASYVTGAAIIGAFKGAYHAVTDEISASIKAASDAEKAHVQLVAALRAQGTAVPSVIAAYQGYADALQRTTIFQDDAIEGAQALLVQVGNVMPRDMEKALQAVTNLASGLGIDLNTATLQVAKAAEGNTTALRKAGVIIDETRAKTEGFGYVLDAINEKFAGQAAAIAGTYSGRLAQLANTWNNVEESVGRVIVQNATVLSAFDLLNQSIAGNTGELNKNNTANEIVSGAVIATARGLALLVEAINLTQSAYFDLRIVSNEVVKAFLNIGIAVLDSTTAIGTATKYLNPVAWTQTWKGGMREVADASTFLKGAVAGLNADSIDAAQTSDKWGSRLTALDDKIAGFTGQLEATRGQTKALKDATDDGVGAWDRHTTAVKKAGTEQKKWANAMVELNSAGKGWQGTLDTMDGTIVEAIKFYLEAGVSQSTLATAYHLTAVEVKAVESALQDETAMAKLSRTIELDGLKKSEDEYKKWAEVVSKSADDVGKRIIEGYVQTRAAEMSYHDFVAQQTLTSTDYQVGKIWEVVHQQEAAFKGSEDQRAAFNRHVEALAHAQTAALYVDNKALVDNNSDTLRQIANKNWTTYMAMRAAPEQYSATTIQKFRQIAQASEDAANHVKHAWLDAFTRIGEKIPALIQQAFTGGGGAAGAGKAIGSMVGEELGKGLVSHMTEKAPEFMGSALGKMFGAAIPVIGALAGPLIEKIINIFSGGAEHIINPIREAFVQLHGGLGALNTEAAAAGVSLTAMLNAKNPEQYKKAIDDLNAAFERFKKWIADSNTELGGLLKSAQDIGAKLPASFEPAIQKLIDMGRITKDNADLFATLTGSTGVDFKKMEEVAKKYGIDLASLGPAFQSAKLGDIAKTIINDFDLLERGGADVDKVLAGMKKPINDLVNDSLKFGVAIPANMKPWIDQLLITGQLVDADGKKITDLSGLKFAAPIETEFDKLIKKIGDLIDVLTGGLPKAITNIPVPKPIKIPLEWGDPGPQRDYGPGPRRRDDGSYGALGGRITSNGVQYLAEGGPILRMMSRGIDTVPIMAAVGEGIVTREGMSRLGDRGLAQLNRGELHERQAPAGSHVVNITVDARGAWFDGQGVKQLSRRIQSDFWEAVSQNKDSAYTKARAALGQAS